MSPIEAAMRWHRWSASGPESAIAQLLSHLDANLPCGWKRLTGNDPLPSRALVKPGSIWYASAGAPTRAGVTLSVERPRESELRGGQVWFAGAPSDAPIPGIAAAWDHVMGLLDQGIVPAARAVGADVQAPSPEEMFLSDLPMDVGDRLRRFSQTARKSLPLTREEAERWHDFVIAAFRMTTIVDPESFTAWLVADGWSRELARALNEQFFDQCILLSRYVDEVSAA